MKFIGRRKPYTEIGIGRKKCNRCGAPAVHQWNCCANGNRYVPLCLECDVELNRLAVEFMRLPGGKKLMRRYEQEIKP